MAALFSSIQAVIFVSSLSLLRQDCIIFIQLIITFLALILALMTLKMVDLVDMDKYSIHQGVQLLNHTI